jgi:hypothetical protein
VSSEVGTGTIFTVTLPVHSGVTATSPAPDAAESRSVVA